MTASTSTRTAAARRRREVEALLHDERLDSLPADYDQAALLAAERAVYVLHQDVAYEYDRPVRDLRQRLMIVPRAQHGDQRRVTHRVRAAEVDTADLRMHRDQFGNALVQVAAPVVARAIRFESRAVLVRRAATTGDAGPRWRHPVPSSTPLTEADEAIRDAAASIGPVRDVAESADALSNMIRDSFEYAHDVTGVRTTASEAWQLRAGVCQDMAHVMIAMCSSLGIAARYVSGHLVGDGASHAWVEIADPAHGRVVAIDPTHRRRTDLRYVTTATGRDYRDVAPTSGTYRGEGARATLTVRKSIRLAELA